MNQTAVMHTDLDQLADRVEKAAILVQDLRDDKARLERELTEMARRLEETSRKLQGQDPTALLGEIQTLRKEQREWQGERREVASRIEALMRKLEKLEA